MRWVVLVSTGLGLLMAPLMTHGAAPARLAVFEFELIDSSLQGELEGIDPADQSRLQLIEAELRERLQQSGRFVLIDTAPVADQIEAAGVLWSCNGCEVAIARRLAADLALIGWVQKVSNLILNLTVVIRDTATREQVFAASVDLRGNTHESWRHGMRYLLDNRLLKE